MTSYSQIDYLTIGHVCRDITPYGPVIGGTAAYSSLAAQALGCRTAVMTSTGPDFCLEQELPGVVIELVPAEETTTFENVYTAEGRQQTIHAVANSLTAKHVPESFLRASIVHLGPIANEIDPEIITLFSNSLVGLTPQGWFRRWDDEGHIRVGAWSAAPDVLPLSAAVILSPEDLPDIGLLDELRQLSQLIVLTQRAGGCTVFFRDETRTIRAPRVTEVNPTGAGDIFAASFLFRLHQTKGNPWEAAEFANRIAAQTVAQESLADKLAAIKKQVGAESQ